MEDPHEIKINKPQYFNPNKNTISEDWRLWKKEFLIYIELTNARSKLSEIGLAYLLLNFMGPVGIEAKENIIFDEPSEEENMDILLKKFDEIFDPPLNEIIERYKFFSSRKCDTETIQNYVARVKKQAAKCNFGEQADKFILDMIMLNMDYYLQQHIFSIENLSLPMAIKFYEVSLINEEKMRNMCDPNFTDTKETGDDFPQNIKEQQSEDESTKDRIYTKEKLSNLLLDNNVKNKEKEKTTKMSHSLEKCLWCNSEHSIGQCAHNKNCWGCKDFPHDICFNCQKNPHADNCSYKRIILPTINMARGPDCSKCSTNHFTYADCPAQHVVCKNCFMPGHYTNVCEKKRTLIIDYQEKVEETLKPSINVEKVYCSWCELQHKPGLCQHNWLCRRCNDFPHNICFYCKNNPHTDNCDFRQVITLPAKNARKNNFSQHRGQVCATCFETDHSSEECNKVQNVFNRQQTSKSSNSRVNKETQSRAANVCKEGEMLNQYPGSKKENNTKRVCFRCNTQHSRNQCPAYNTTCSNCHKLGHFTHACKSKNTQESYSNCPMCNSKDLRYIDEFYNYCNHCQVYILKEDPDYEDVSSDSSVKEQNANRQQRRRRRRRPNHNRQSKDDVSCSIS